MKRSTTIHDREVAHQVISRSLADGWDEAEGEFDADALATHALDGLQAEAEISSHQQTIVVLVVRDPDYENDYVTVNDTGVALQTVDIDVGRTNLDDEEDLAGFIASHRREIGKLRQAGHDKAADEYERLLTEALEIEQFPAGVHWTGEEGDPVEAVDDPEERAALEHPFESDMDAAIAVAKATGLHWLLYLEQADGHWAVHPYATEVAAGAVVREFEEEVEGVRENAPEGWFIFDATASPDGDEWPVPHPSGVGYTTRGLLETMPHCDHDGCERPVQDGMVGLVSPDGAVEKVVHPDPCAVELRAAGWTPKP